MGAPFSDITIYSPTPHAVGSDEYIEDTSLKNYISDLYVQKMYGYKPPKTSRITIQPAFHEVWGRTWKNGSIVTIAPFYSHDEYASLDKYGKYKYILDLIQVSTLQLSHEYKWDKKVFEKAYQEVIDDNFNFKIIYSEKLSRDKKKAASLSVEKTETITSLYVTIKANDQILKIKLFDKQNAWCYDSVYFLARNNKWFDTNKFGVTHSKFKIDIWYSLEDQEVQFFQGGTQVAEIDFKNYFIFG